MWVVHMGMAKWLNNTPYKNSNKVQCFNERYKVQWAYVLHATKELCGAKH